jgi:hypothetical protein
LIKTRALIAKDFVDDVELEDEGIAEVLLDDNAMAKAPRPGNAALRVRVRVGVRVGGRESSARARFSPQALR